MIKSYYNHNKDLKMTIIMYTLNKSMKFDKIMTYPYGTNAFKICESEVLSKYE